jgi:uncharacterized membrane protein YhhN
MNNKLANFFLSCFIAAAVAITIAAAGNYSFSNVVKPMLMPLLIGVLLAGKTTNAGLVITGLVFSWAGDVLLMFESNHALFFIGGLVCFLITHICYIIYFFRIRSPKSSLLRKQPWVAALVAAYGVSLVQFLFPHLGEMKIPVLLYAIVICTMLVYSLHVFTKINRPANWMFVAGALFFAASDSLLAINKFYQPFEWAGALIISTYCVAQLLIVMGVVRVRS